MAADVDKKTSEAERKTAEKNGLRTPASESRFYRGVWTLMLVCAAPLVAYGIKYYQDTQLLKRHVRLFLCLQLN